MIDSIIQITLFRKVLEDTWISFHQQLTIFQMIELELMTRSLAG